MIPSIVRTRIQPALRSVGRIDLRKIDTGFACLLALDLILESALAHGVPRAERLPSALVAVPFAGTIAVRRRWPAGALVTGAALGLLQQLLRGALFTTLPSESAEFVPILCSYGVGAWLELRRGVVAVALASALLYGMVLIARYSETAPGSPGWSAGLSLVVFFFGVPWILGCVIREHSRRAGAFSALEAAAVAERIERQRVAVASERVLIGRELQDIIAHNVSVMVVQAGGARRVIEREPERARESMLAVEQTGREALAEMRRLLGLLRSEDDPRALAPQPGLDQLPELADSLSGAGLTCELRTEGEPIALTPGINLVAYRVIEATLAGAARGGCASATATIRYLLRRLELEVHGDRPLPDLQVGLEAVTERVGLYGGGLEFVTDSSAPFAIRCELPLEVA